MGKLKFVNGLLAVFVTLPLWLGIMYQVLQGINASDLLWFMYWVYVPVVMFVTFISRVLADD
jgi:hypothetical protein